MLSNGSVIPILPPHAAAVYTGGLILRYVAYILLADFKRNLEGVVKVQKNVKQLEGVLKSLRSEIMTEGRWRGIIEIFLIAYTSNPKLLFVKEFGYLSLDNENLGPLNLFIEASGHFQKLM